MMIVRAAKDIAACTELMFLYKAPKGIYDLLKVKQKFKNLGFICRYALCKDIKVTKLLEVTKRKSMLT
jgi:hypothetical protein